MEWRQNHHSRGAIDRAGEILRTQPYIKGGDSDMPLFREYMDAFSIMEDWRASHAFPLNTFQVSLRHRAAKISENAEVFQRMKRAHSVIQKLKKFPEMSLSRMQDIGGCRAILEHNHEVEELRQLYLDSRDRHKLATEKNYILNPKPSGYRGRHLVYRYQSDRNEIYNKHRIEIQLRSRVQHYWATAVEVAGLFVQSPLKSSIGPKDWLEFFKFASSCFSILEGTPTLHSNLSEKEIIHEAKIIESRLDACDRLRGFSDSHSVLTSNVGSRSSHFVLKLDVSTNTLEIEAFPNVSDATRRYAELEMKFVNSDSQDVVLVSAESAESLSRGYPNYFSDTEGFIKIFKEITA